MFYVLIQAQSNPSLLKYNLQKSFNKETKNKPHLIMIFVAVNLFVGAQTNIESDKHRVVDKHWVRQTSSQTNIESDKHRVRQTSSQTNIELISKNKCLLRQTSSQTNTEYLIEIYKIWSTGTNIKLDIHRVRQTSSQTNIK